MIGPRARRRLVRHKMCLFAHFLQLHANLMGYAQDRPMRSFFTRWCVVPPHPTDCSESTAMIAGASGAPTPYVVNDLGFTGTQLAALEHIAFSQTRRADFIVFRNAAHPEGEHVVMLLQGGRRFRDPLVWSHGRPGVDVMPLSQMKRGFPGYEVVYLRTVPERYTKAEYVAVQKARTAGRRA